MQTSSEVGILVRIYVMSHQSMEYYETRVIQSSCWATGRPELLKRISIFALIPLNPLRRFLRILRAHGIPFWRPGIIA